MTEILQAAAFIEKIQKGEACCILDVRTSPEYREVRLNTTCLSVPLDQLNAEKVCKALGDSSKPLYVLCKGGVRARKAADLLKQGGLSSVTVIDGGLDACIACGAEIVRGQGGVSLERQVRMAAGLFVLLGLSLGTFFDPLFYALSAFIGAGLLFSGLTGWCGMALLLAKAPWNR